MGRMMLLGQIEEALCKKASEFDYSDVDLDLKRAPNRADFLAVIRLHWAQDLSEGSYGGYWDLAYKLVREEDSTFPRFTVKLLGEVARNMPGQKGKRYLRVKHLDDYKTAMEFAAVLTVMLTRLHPFLPM